MRERIEAVARGLAQGGGQVEPGKAKMRATRDEVQRGWFAASEILMRQEQPDLAAQARRFAEQMPPSATERERLANELVKRLRPPRARDARSR